MPGRLASGKWRLRAMSGDCRGRRHRPNGTSRLAGGAPVFLLIAASLMLAACGTKQTLEQAIQCDAFKRGADGTWSAINDVSLDFLLDGVQHQLNLSKGVTVSATVARQEPQLLPTLERKCAPKP
jgi:hypothetical protein